MPRQSVMVSPVPASGTVVTVTYDLNARRELPVNPKIERIRPDLDWVDILKSSGQDKSVFDGMRDIAERCVKLILSLDRQESLLSFTTHARGHWTHATMRAFMEQFAKNTMALDPLSPSTWYTVDSKLLYKLKVLFYLLLLNLFICP